jgi:cysteine synthase
MHIGDTPLIRLERVVPDNGVEIWVKWEGANPTGSMKDRMALSMIRGAVARGQLRAGGRVVEYTGGSTGSSLAMVCAALGYQAHFVSSDAFAAEKLQTMRAFGARLDVVPSEGGKITPALIQAIIAQAKALSTEPNTFWTDQFNNPDNPAGYQAMAEETIAALGGRLDEFVMMVGTAGCFSGNAAVFKVKVPGVRCIAGEPATSRALSTTTGPFTGHRIEGTGPGFAPANYRADLADAVVAVSDADAYATARRLACEEGIFGGISSGANVWIALQRARALPAGARIVTTICDSGLKYLQGDLYRS